MESKKTRTHYDNLKVSRDAPLEVIRAAYRALAQRYHPDKHNGDEQSARIMMIVNASYEVLSDPNRRAEHDAWIQSQSRIADLGERAVDQRQTTARHPEAESPYRGASRYSQSSHAGADDRLKARSGGSPAVFAVTVLLVVVGALFLSRGGLDGEPSRSTLPEYNAAPLPYRGEAKTESLPPAGSSVSSDSAGSISEPDLYVRPPLAPNGETWPPRAGYLTGLPKLNTDGLSSVTVDNSGNGSDVFVKLVAIEQTTTYPVRQFYIPANSKFKVANVTAGKYDIRYQDLSSGGLSRSESFDLEEIRESDGTRYSAVTMTLYEVSGGNVEMYPLSAEEF